ncbi:MAG TPA: ABC transporter permease subunit, partial [Myxococcota bacterium]|nr:ABC transporter permease subunit [Myxococcota bacterium]
MRRLLGQDWAPGLLFALPLIVLLLTIIAWPFLRAFWMSFHSVFGPRWGAWVGLRNYAQQLEDPSFWRSFLISVQYTIEADTAKFLIGLVAALALHNVKRFSGLLTALILAPFIVPEVVTAAIFRLMYNPIFGGLNLTLRALYTWTHGLLGHPQGFGWTGDPALALHAMVAVNVWKGVPFFTLLALAGLKAIDRELYDASAVDGANAWQRFLHITLPGLRYVIIVETLFSTISTFNTFGLVYLITQGGPGGATKLYALRVYELLGASMFGQGVAVAMLMAPILGIAVIILGRYMRAGQRGDEGGENALYRGLMLAVWPLKMAVRLAVWLFWRANDVLEQVAGAIGRAFLAVFSRGNVSTQRRISRGFVTALTWLTIVVVAFIELYPFYWIVVTSFKTSLQFQQFRSVFWPDPWTLEHYTWVLTKSPWLLWLRNTVTVALVAMVISLAVSAFGAYALVRLRWRGSGFLSTAVLITYLMPGIMLVVPLYQLFANLRLVNSLGALMVAYPTFLMPLACWLLMGYYRSIPEELEEAAQIDGCNRFQGFIRVVLPLVLPALMAVALFAVTSSWNEFLFAFVFTQSNDATTLPVGMGRWIVGDVFAWGQIMASAVMMSVPVIAFYALAQRFLVEGLTAGSVK